jgi:undecaprenol kinase
MTRLHGLSSSFRAAWRGLLVAFKGERTFRVMLGMGLLVVAIIAVLPLHTWERVVLLLSTATVLVLELLNSLVERLADLLKPRLSVAVGEVKDLAAAAVLTASICTAVVGLIILLPHINALMHQF